VSVGATEGPAVGSGRTASTCWSPACDPAPAGGASESVMA